jgi:hypothetical protein
MLYCHARQQSHELPYACTPQQLGRSLAQVSTQINTHVQPGAHAGVLHGIVSKDLLRLPQEVVMIRRRIGLGLLQAAAHIRQLQSQQGCSLWQLSSGGSRLHHSRVP